jgi:cytochrome c oxidase subunit II
MRIVCALALVVVLALAAACAVAQSPATVAEGKKVYADQGCYGCHAIEKTGTPIGPDLSHLGSKYAEADLAQWLRDPASQKPTAHMPKIQLDEREVKALAAYLSSLR